MGRTSRALVVSLLAAFAALSVNATSARAELANVTGGQSVLEVNLAAVQQLGQDRVFTVMLPPATLSFRPGTSQPIATFPITGGFIDTDTMTGTVNLGGAIRIVKYNEEFTEIEQQLDVTNLRVFNSNLLLGDTAGLLPGPAADLANDVHSEQPEGDVHHEADMQTNDVGALILNTYFSTDVFTGGLVLGHLISDIETDLFSGFPRPQGAANARVPLAIAYDECEAPDRQHSGGIDQSSCGSVSPSSDWLTAGTNDANGKSPQFNGSVRLTFCPNGTSGLGTCSTPAGMTAPDVRLEARLSDVRCANAAQVGCEGDALSDYGGELQVRIPLRLTDRSNGPAGGPYEEPATVSDFPFTFTAPCTANPAGGDPTAVGADCTVVTAANAVVPGSVQSGDRAIWDMEAVTVLDGGADGDADTPDNTEFARQGVFIP